MAEIVQSVKIKKRGMMRIIEMLMIIRRKMNSVIFPI